MPRSPWLASAGCTNCAGVPVEAKVAAILRATWPDLPMPETITRRAARASVSRPPRRSSAPRPPASARAPRPRSPARAARWRPACVVGLAVRALHPSCLQLCAKMSWSAQPARSSAARWGRKSKAGLGQRLAPLPRQPGVERRAQPVQVEHVRRGIVELRRGQRLRAPVARSAAAWRCRGRAAPQQELQPVPVGVGPHQPRGDLGAVDRRGQHAEALQQHRDVEPPEVEELQHRRVAEQPGEVRRRRRPGRICTRCAVPSPPESCTRQSRASSAAT
jgi:hypothetical protein